MAHRCKGEKCFPPVKATEKCPEPNRVWSEPKDWDRSEEGFPDRKLREDTPLPQAGDEFIIPAGWNMEYDMEDSPIYETIDL